MASSPNTGPLRFVGLEKELDAFAQMLNMPYSPNRIKSIKGQGGIGKTWLVLSMLDKARERGGFVVPAQPIDMYATNNRHIEGVIEVIVGYIEVMLQEINSSGRRKPIVADFARYHQVCGELAKFRGDRSSSPEELDRLLREEADAFRADLSQLCLEIPVVLAFDTFEHVYDTSVGQWITAEEGLQTPGLITIIAGRELGSDFPDQRELRGLDDDEVMDFYARYWGLTPSSVDNTSFVNYLQALNSKAEGNPLLLGLAIAWMNEQVLPLEKVKGLSPNEFRKELINYLSPESVNRGGSLFRGIPDELNEPLRQTLVCMAYLNRRFNKSFLDHLVQARYIRGVDADTIWTALKSDDVKESELLFIKERPDGDLQLHDILAELLRIYVLPDSFGDGHLVRQPDSRLHTFVRDVQGWYDELIQSETPEDMRERPGVKFALLQAEKLAYALQLDILADSRFSQFKDEAEAQRLGQLLPADLEQGQQLLQDYRRDRLDFLNRLLLSEIRPESIEVLLSGDQGEGALPLERRYRIYIALAGMANDSYDYFLARQYWDKAIEQAEMAGQPDWQVRTLIDKHNSTWQSAPGESFAILEEARRLGEQHNLFLHLAETFYEIGFAYKSVYNYALAATWYQKALQLAEEHDRDERVLTARILNDMGYNLHLQGHYDQAQAYINQAYFLRNRICQQAESQLEEMLQQQTRVTKHSAEWIELGRKVRDSYDTWYLRTLEAGMSINTQGEIARQNLNDMASATAAYDEALAIFKDLANYYWQAKALVARSDAHRRLAKELYFNNRTVKSEEYDELAYKDVQAASEICNNYRLTSLKPIVHRRLGRLYHDRALHSGNPQSALMLLQQAQSEFETGLDFAKRNADTMEELENATELTFLANDFLWVYRRINLKQELDLEQKMTLQGLLNKLRQTIIAHRSDPNRVYQFSVFEDLLKIEEAAFQYEQGLLSQAFELYLEGYTGLARDPGNGSARCKLHMDHLLTNIRRLPTLEERQQWYNGFIQRWQKEPMQRMEKKKVADFHPQLMEQFWLGMKFD